MAFFTYSAVDPNKKSELVLLFIWEFLPAEQQAFIWI